MCPPVQTVTLHVLRLSHVGHRRSFHIVLHLQQMLQFIFVCHCVRYNIAPIMQTNVPSLRGVALCVLQNNLCT